jgi:hypothetical protein
MCGGRFQPDPTCPSAFSYALHKLIHEIEKPPTYTSSLVFPLFTAEAKTDWKKVFIYYLSFDLIIMETTTGNGNV